MGRTGVPWSSTTASRRPAIASVRSSSSSVARPLRSARAIDVALMPVASANSRWLRSARRRALRSTPVTSRHPVMHRASMSREGSASPGIQSVDGDQACGQPGVAPNDVSQIAMSLLRGAAQRHSRATALIRRGPSRFGLPSAARGGAETQRVDGGALCECRSGPACTVLRQAEHRRSGRGMPAQGGAARGSGVERGERTYAAPMRSATILAERTTRGSPPPGWADPPTRNTPGTGERFAGRRNAERDPFEEVP